MNDKRILIYYIYILVILCGCSYVVFGLGFSGWWFLVAIVLTDISPTKGKE